MRVLAKGEAARELTEGDDRARFDREVATCPRDDVPMRRVLKGRREEVLLDVCMSCGGVWLDAGELARIRREYPDVTLDAVVEQEE